MIEVKISELKARLSEYLREVRAGNAVTVMARDTPVARIVPLAGPAGSITVRRPHHGAAALHQVKPPPRIPGLSSIDALLAAEREG